jgi:hypothetical protein
MRTYLEGHKDPPSHHIIWSGRTAATTPRGSSGHLAADELESDDDEEEEAYPSLYNTLEEDDDNDDDESIVSVSLEDGVELSESLRQELLSAIKTD